MRWAIHRGAAAVESQRLVTRGSECFDGSAEGVVKLNGHLMKCEGGKV